MTTINTNTTTNLFDNLNITESLNGVTIEPAGSSNNDTLDQDDFLLLLTTQLQTQDPLSPQDNQEMIAQMAQFSSVAGISEMNTSLQSIADLIGEQTALLQDIRSATQTPVTETPT